jgi:DHA2 family multidrug resistance protein
MTEATGAHAPLTGATLTTAGVVLGLANFTVVLDTTIANVSVPHIAGAMAVSPAQGTWVITSYAVAEAITVPLTGWLVQRFGAVRVFAIAVLGFGVCSALCGLAPSFGALVAFRILQGLCGGPIMPTSQTLLLHIYPKERATQALGLWAMTSVLGPMLGPLLGGVISDGAGWRWIFLINIPVSLAVAVASQAMLRRQETPSRRTPVDYVGLGLLTLWVAAMQIVLDKGRELDWFSSTFIVSATAVAVVGFVAFLVWELTSEHPIVDLRIFRHRGFTVGVTTLSLCFGIFFGTIVLLPLWLQTSLGYTATLAGYVGALNGLPAVIVAPLAANLIRHVDGRVVTFLGVIGMIGIALYEASFTTSVTFWGVAAAFIAQGVLTPFYFIPTNYLIMASVPPEEAAAAAGVSNFLRTSSGAFAASVMTTSWDSMATRERGQLVGRMNAVPDALDSLVAGGLSPSQALEQLSQMVQAQAFVLALNRLFLISAVMLVFVAAVVWLMPKNAGVTVVASEGLH